MVQLLALFSDCSMRKLEMHQYCSLDINSDTSTENIGQYLVLISVLSYS